MGELKREVVSGEGERGETSIEKVQKGLLSDLTRVNEKLTDSE